MASRPYGTRWEAYGVCPQCLAKRGYACIDLRTSKGVYPQRRNRKHPTRRVATNA